MRHSLALILGAIASGAAALPSADALRDMARNADIAALEAAFDDAQQQFHAGAADADDMRDMVSALTVTDPAIRQAMADWIAADPSSPQAATIVAFNRYEDSFALRGERTASETWPAALDAFRSYQAEGTALARAAYDAAPDFVPAADAVMAFQATTRTMPPDLFNAMVAAVMERTPNRGSLRRAAYQALPQWGGGGPLEVAARCTAHADKVNDGMPYSVEACFIDAVTTYGFGQDSVRQAAHLLMTSEAAGLDDLRVTLGLIADPVEAQAALLAYLERETTTDVEQAQIYDANYAIPQGLPLMLPVVGARHVAEARALLQDDPYNRRLIQRLFDAERWDQLAPPLLSPEEVLTLSRDMLIGAPFDPEAWIQLTLALHGAGRGDDPAMLSAGINAVAYSMHHSGPLGNLRGDLMRAAQRLAEAGYPGVSDDTAFDGLELTLCPLVRADRLMTAACETPDDSDWMCGSNTGATPVIAALVAEIAARNWCGWERTAPLAEIVFLPVPVDLAALVP